MGENNADLAALIGSRICHDLISPIGAITNGLELLDLTGGVRGPEMDLIADSVGNAGARIRFFRIAYGASGDETLARSEIASVLRDIGRGSRIEIRWAPLDPLPRAQVRLAFLALQCFETALPYGGRIEVHCDRDAWRVSGRAKKMNVDAALWDGLERIGGQARITPALVQFALLPDLAAEQGRALRVTRDGDALRLRF